MVIQLPPQAIDDLMLVNIRPSEIQHVFWGHPPGVVESPGTWCL